MTVTLRRPVVKRCPHRDEIDAGELVIRLPGSAPELHGLAEAIERLVNDPITHEDFTSAVASMLPTADVATLWTTGPWTVEVTAQPAPTQMPLCGFTEPHDAHPPCPGADHR